MPERMSLAQLRRHLGVTQVDLAARTGYTQQRISDIEHAELTTLTIRVLGVYLTGLGCRLRVAASFEESEYDLT